MIIKNLFSKPTITLQLANGRTINLSTQNGNIQASGIKLNNHNKTLTYKASENAAPAAINTLRVPSGLDYKIKLADGTTVWMNSFTELKFPLTFTGNTRDITINGEAFLEVAHNPSKPFIVHLPNSTVKVLGTKFNVNTYDSSTVFVALVEGSVNMQTSVGSAQLVPGKQAVLTKGKSVKVEDYDPKYVLSWQQGLFYFDEVSLQKISKIVPRWFGMQVVIDNPTDGSKKFVGVLDRKKPISVFQSDLKMISGIDSYIDKDSVLHFK